MSNLRARAEATLEDPSDEDELVQELRVHQVELALQNEELQSAQIEIAKSRDAWLSLYDLAPVAYLTLDDRGRVLSANSRALLVIGATGVDGRPLSAFMPVPDADRFYLHLRAVFAGGGRKECDVEIDDRPVRVVSTRYGDDATRCLTALIDQVERRDPRSRGHQGADVSVGTVMDASLDAVCLIDGDGVILQSSRTAEALFGVGHDAMRGKPLSEFVDVGAVNPDSRARFDTVGRRTDGSTFPLEASTTGVSVGLDPPRFVFLKDRTNPHSIDRRLFEARTHFRLIAEQVEDVFYMLDASTHEAVYVSPAFLRVFGRSERPSLTEYMGWIVPEDRARFEQAHRVFAAGGRFNLEYRIDRTGRTVVVHDRAYFVDSLGLVTGVVRDVTEERRLEAQLIDAQRLEAIGTLTAGISHDFNNLLTGLGGCVASALRHLESNHPARSAVEEILGATRRGVGLTQQLTDFSRGHVSRTEPVDLDDTIEGSRTLIEGVVDRAIVVSFELEAGTRVLVGSGEVEQILTNLARNAGDAMPNGGRLSIATYAVEVDSTEGGRLDIVEGAYSVIVVTDTGCGMDEATCARAFEPFFTTKSAGHGAGLGLATTHSVVRRRGGHVDLESAVGRGTTVTIHLPLLGAAPNGDRRPEPPGGRSK